MRTAFFTVLFLYATLLSAQTAKERSVSFAREGIKLVDQKKYSEGIAAFRQGAALDPDNSLFAYEIAAAFYMQAEYDSVIRILSSVITKPNVNDQFYQVLGNAWDMKKMPDKALKTYQAGLNAFPESGILYLECGILMLSLDSVERAISFWEQGVNADPCISSNYYYLTKALALSDNKQWALIYGEVFLNIERNSKRSEEISKLMYDTYMAVLQNPADIIKSVISYNASVPDGNAQPNMLTAFHSELDLKGYYEAYLHWMLMKGDDELFTSWLNSNAALYKSFVDWFKKNPLMVSKKNYLSRMK